MNFTEMTGGSYAAFSASKFLERKINSFEYNVPVVVYEIDEGVFYEVKQKVEDYFGSAAEVITADGDTKKLKDATFSDTLIIKSVPYIERKRFGFGDLVEIIRRLRDPDGCPWDRAQTYNSIRSCAIEEAYELVEAVELKDKDKILEESGDVMLQGLFHASIAEDSGDFNFNVMISALAYKLVSRHTHIFGAHNAANEEQALNFWEKAKAKEKGQKSIGDKLDSVPKTFSALMRALKVQKIIKKTGFEFPSVENALDKVREETAEFAEATDNQEEEAGDLLFSVVNLLRMHHIDPEIALNATTDKFIRRFLYVDQKAREAGVALEDCSLETMEGWYQEYKRLYEKTCG